MIELPRNEIHLWLTSSQKIQSPALLDQYKTLMNAEESQKQQRYKFAKDRHSALVTRAFVRTTLSHYGERQPQDWQFVKGEKDKPEIANAPLPLRFNLSHTQDLIICAIAQQHDLGADVENMTRDSEVLDIADRFFSPSEVSELFSLSTQSEQRSRFFDYWTLKESYIKAVGLGLAIPLDHFSFSIGARHDRLMMDEISLSFSPERNDNPNDWHSWLLYPSDIHRIALSIRNTAFPYTLRFFYSTPLLSFQEIELPLKNTI